MSTILKAFEENKLVAVIRSSSSENAEEMFKAAKAGGFRVFEISVQNAYSWRMIESLSKIADVIVGANTVTDGELAQRAINAGAQFISTPYTDDEIISVAKNNNTFVIQGAASPSEAVFAHQSGANLVKIYPAAQLGGPSYIKAVKQAAPFLKLIAAGGVSVDSVFDYLKDCVAVTLGESLFERPLVRADNWSEITARARQFNQKLETSKVSR